MQNTPKRRWALDLVLTLGLVLVAATFGVEASNAQTSNGQTGNAKTSNPKTSNAKTANAKAAAPARGGSLDPNINPVPGARYFVDFRARTAASYGHAFVWYGRVGEKAIEVAGLHPATESVIPYILGHVIPVPAETGASYGDLDEQYLTASYRVTMSEAEAKLVIAYIKRMQSSSIFWSASVYNCVTFISNIAQYMGLQVPKTTLLYPENWVNDLKQLNGKNPQLKVAQSAGMRVD